VGCGSGRHANIFYQKGHNVIGIDSSKAMINLAKKQFPQINFFCQNAKNFKLNTKFDLVVLNFHVINFFSPAVIFNFFKSAKKHLKKNGLLIFDFVGKYALIFDKPKKKTKFFFDRNEKLKIIRTTTPQFSQKKSIFKIIFNIAIYKKKEKIKKFKEIHTLYLYSLADFIKKTNLDFEYIKSYKYLTQSKFIEKKHWNGLCIFKKVLEMV